MQLKEMFFHAACLDSRTRSKNGGKGGIPDRLLLPSDSLVEEPPNNLIQMLPHPSPPDEQPVGYFEKSREEAKLTTYTPQTIPGMFWDFNIGITKNSKVLLPDINHSGIGEQQRCVALRFLTILTKSKIRCEFDISILNDIIIKTPQSSDYWLMPKKTPINLAIPFTLLVV